MLCDGFHSKLWTFRDGRHCRSDPGQAGWLHTDDQRQQCTSHHPFLYQRTVFDPVKDFEPVALLAPAGKLKVLGVVHEKRVPPLPGAPTIGETVKGFGATPWYGMLAQASTAKELIQFVQNEVSKAVGSADARDRLATLGCEPFKGTSEQLASIVWDGLVPWSRTVKESGAKLD